MKKKMIIIIVIVLIILAVIGAILLLGNDSKTDTKSQIADEEYEENNEVEEADYEEEVVRSKSMVVYFSATGNTENVAKKLQAATNSDIAQIKPKEEYSEDDLNYNNDDCRANKEQNDKNARPEIEPISDIEEYEVIYLGYPIWWGDVPKVILTLLDNYNFENKTIIPFCTSGSTDISQSMDTLKSYNEKVNWVEGKRFSGSEDEKDIKEWINGLNINK